MKISKILSYVVLAVGILSAVLLYLMNSNISQLMVEKEATEARELPLGLATAAVSPLYSLALVIIVVLIVATIATVISGLIKNPSSLKKVGLGVAVFAVIVGIGYALSSGQEVITKDGDIISAGTTKLVEAGIISFYIFSALAVVSVIFGMVRNSISN